jgi:hypothetical protein
MSGEQRQDNCEDSRKQFHSAASVWKPVGATSVKNSMAGCPGASRHRLEVTQATRLFDSKHTGKTPELRSGWPETFVLAFLLLLVVVILVLDFKTFFEDEDEEENEDDLTTRISGHALRIGDPSSAMHRLALSTDVFG